MDPCMTDSFGRQMEKWLPHMQSSDFLRSAIARGERTRECWSELTRRRKAIHRVREVLATAKRPAPGETP